MRFSSIIAFLCLILMAAPALGQAVVFRPDDVLPRLKEVSPEAFYINGHDIHGLSDEAAQSFYLLGDSAKYLLALVTLRLADKGVIDVNASVAKVLPDLLDFNPFEVAVTPKHLLSETAGFAKLYDYVDYGAETAPLRYFLIKTRGAGQIAVDDPAGWQLLVALLERKSGRPIVDLVKSELFAPLAIDDPVFEDANPESPIHTPLAIHHMRGDSLAAIFGLLAHNLQANGQPFLQKGSWDYLTSKPLWQLHPLGPARLAGLQMVRQDNHVWVENSEADCSMAPRLMAFPAAGVVFVSLPSDDADVRCNVFSAIAARSGIREIPPNWGAVAALNAANQLVPATRLDGLYNCADTASSIASRIALARTCHLKISGSGVHDLQLDVTDGSISMTTELTKQAPYAYEAVGARRSLFFSPYRAGGYAVLRGQAYVRVGVLGYLQTHVGAYVPLMIVILLTGALHIRSKTSVQWRRYGWFCLVGAALVGFGLYADWFWWPAVLYELQMPWLIVLWRTGLNVGLMLMLALPMLSMTFIRQQNMPEKGFALLFAGPHLGLISLAAIGLFLTTIIWGMAGTFTAY